MKRCCSKVLVLAVLTLSSHSLLADIQWNQKEIVKPVEVSSSVGPLSASDIKDTLSAMTVKERAIARAIIDGRNPANKKAPQIVPESLDTKINISFRNQTLANSIKRLSPKGWEVDLQINKALHQSLVSFSGETTYKQALHDVLSPQGLTFLAYKNMKPSPLLVITGTGVTE